MSHFFPKADLIPRLVTCQHSTTRRDPPNPPFDFISRLQATICGLFCPIHPLCSILVFHEPTLGMQMWLSSFNAQPVLQLCKQHLLIRQIFYLISVGSVVHQIGEPILLESRRGWQIVLETQRTITWTLKSSSNAMYKSIYCSECSKPEVENTILTNKPHILRF